MKKMLAFLLAAVMILTTALSMTAFAAPEEGTPTEENGGTAGDGTAGGDTAGGDTAGGDTAGDGEGAAAGTSGRMEDDKGTIILKSTVKDETYKIYKIFDLASFSDDDTSINNHSGDAYSYLLAKDNNAWVDFFKTGDGAAYIDIDFSEDAVVTVDGKTWYVVKGYKMGDGAFNEPRKEGTGEDAKTFETDFTDEDTFYAQTAQDFARKALAYAAANRINADYTKTGDGKDITIDKVGLGYYLLSSSAGTLLSLDTTNLTATVYEKNDVPASDKEVQETDLDTAADKKGDGVTDYGKSGDANIGDGVYFKSIVNVEKGSVNYTLHDTMSKGLTFDKNSVKVYLTERKYATGADMAKSKWVQVENGKATDLTDLIGKSYTAATAKFYTLTENVKHTDWNPEETHTFDAAFDQDFMNDIDAAIIKDGKQFSLVLLYSATLNGSAVIAGDGNTNTMNVTYGDTQKTTPVKTVTYTWKLDILKYTGDGDDKTPLDGAQFQLKNGKGTVLKFIKLADGSYRYDARVQDTEIPAKGQGDTQDTIKSKDIPDPDDATKTVTVVDTITTSSGKLSIVGLDGGDYTIAETVAPKGYNKLAADIPVHITSDAEDKAESVKYGDDNTATAGQVVIKGTPNELASANDNQADVQIDIKNETGTELPSTGGMGTTLFYVIGAILVIGAGVLLVVRRRMSDR